MKLLAIYLIASCASEPIAPTVRVIFDDNIPAEDVRWVEQGAFGWHALGFEVVHDTRPECSLYWYDFGESDCQISLLVSKESPKLAYGGARTDRKARHIWIDMTEHGYELMTLMAHETGHAVLNVEHLPPDEIGLMAASFTASMPTHADFVLACSTIGGIACEK